jgi:hypothetical protein
VSVETAAVDFVELVVAVITVPVGTADVVSVRFVVVMNVELCPSVADAAKVEVVEIVVIGPDVAVAFVVVVVVIVVLPAV